MAAGSKTKVYSSAWTKSSYEGDMINPNVSFAVCKIMLNMNLLCISVWKFVSNLDWLGCSAAFGVFTIEDLPLDRPSIRKTVVCD